MSSSSQLRGDRAKSAAECLDVLFIGAGISGIGGAYHLRHQAPHYRFAILDEQDSFGGTWHTHRYPGIRSDSELYTFGYRFKPWVGAPIATAEEILKYLGDVVQENGLEQHIRYRHRVLGASWSTRNACWTVKGVRTDTQEPFTLQARFLWMGQGYYHHDKGHFPEWPGMEDYRGTLIHPQQWPEDLDLGGKRVVLIGSGATAATIIPAIAGRCAHVTMLQRSPTYFKTGRNADELADMLRGLSVPEAWVHEIVRRKLLKEQQEVVEAAFSQPEALRERLLAGVLEHLGSQEMVDQHFAPRYLPWRQRIAFVPDGDLFKALRSGAACVVTDEIERFERDGIRVKSGDLLQADIVVAATGLELAVMGGIAFTVDGRPVDFAQTVMYRGAMFTGVPNLLWVFGYFRASWTLRVDLLGDFFCRLLAFMERRQAAQVTPGLRPEDAGMQLLPWVEPSSFNPGYLMRVMDRMPRQGSQSPWQHTQDYWRDSEELPAASLDDGALVFAGSALACQDLAGEAVR